MKLQAKPHCDPIKLGANCAACPLYKDGKYLAKPVPSEVRPSKLAILTEAPGQNEELEGRPLIGASGYLLNWAMAGLGFKRNDVSILNTLLCRPPKDFRPEQWRAAIEACRARFERDLAEAQPKVIFATGSRALQITTGKASVTPWYGAPLDSHYGVVLPSVHPAFVLRKPAYMPVFKRWLQTAWLLAQDKLPAWDWGELVIEPTKEHLERLLAAGKPIAIDIENDGDPLDPSVEILCIGVGNEDLAVSIDWGLATGELRGVLKTLLESDLPKVGHNFSHDLLGLETKGWKVNGERHDTLLLHAILAPQLPHGLSDVAAFETHADRWKSTFRAGKDDKSSAKEKGAWLRRYQREPEVVKTYNCSDVVMTARLFKLLMAQL